MCQDAQPLLQPTAILFTEMTRQEDLSRFKQPTEAGLIPGPECTIANIVTSES